VAIESIKVPDLGGASGVEVIELLVSPGQAVAKDDSLLVLESDKAAMEIPAPMAGTVKSISVNLGDEVSQGDEMLILETDAGEQQVNSDAASHEEKAEQTPEPNNFAVEEKGADQASPDSGSISDSGSAGKAIEEDIIVPDLGTDEAVEVIEVHVSIGEEVAKDDSLITLESDKAAMDIPSPKGGEITHLQVKVGDKISTGGAIAKILTKEGGAGVSTDAQSVAQLDAQSQSSSEGANKGSTTGNTHQSAEAGTDSKSKSVPAVSGESSQYDVNARQQSDGANVYAGPAVRKLARELGVTLSQISGTGARGRIIKEDVQKFVKSRMTGTAAPAVGVSGMGFIASVDYSQFGEIEEKPLSKLHKLTAANMHRNWSNIPQVAQFNEADVTELELFRAQLKPQAEKKGVKLTFLPFLIKACVKALQEYPQFNVSLHESGEAIVQKKYFNIGIAVATEAGLLVPVIRNADTKSVWQLAAELVEITDKAKGRKLSLQDMQGACFSISSLGAIGGTGFIPIVNAPEVAILGVGKTQIKPVYLDEEFVPRKMLPLTLSYDHRAVNGVDGGLFSSYLVSLLSDIRHLSL